MLRNSRKRKYDGKVPEELLSERNEYLKKVVEQGKIMESMRRNLEDYEELKESYEQQTETFHELFEKGIIDRNGKIIDNKME